MIIILAVNAITVNFKIMEEVIPNDLYYWIAIVDDVEWLVDGYSQQDVRDKIALEEPTAFVDLVTKSSIVKVLL